MDDDVTKDEMTREELEEVIEKSVTKAVNKAIGTGTLAPLISVDDRMKERWPQATQKNRWRVRDVFASVHRERLGRPPYKLTGAINGIIVVEQEHLHLLELAIE